ncbi:MAG: MlaE family lipid ABC transporter permease subunit [Deltaproteobacteria bacterium]|nr:MlaE family lipid ABC transporter permease subunit [Deltaproteobacteria bacterium]
MATEQGGQVIPSPKGAVLRLSGRLRREGARQLAEQLDRALPGRDGLLQLDLSAVEELDSAAVAVLLQGWRRARARGGRLLLRAGASEAALRSLSMFRTREQPDQPPHVPTLLESWGEGLLSAAAALRDLLQLAADTSAALLRTLVRPTTLRRGPLAEQAVYIGSQALPIIGLISFLVGLTLAFQSAYQLQQFGAAIFVANLTGVAIVREMGPLMTAILVAGRSGSSIAAEISTMKVSEEVDALQTMGLDPVEFLAVPRLLAILLTMPLLTVLADLLGICGGFIVGVFYLDISATAFLNQTLTSLAPKDLLTGLVKSLAFAWGIGLIGLHYGFKVRGGAAEVGRTTTASVVASIFYIIVADCLFSVVFYILL